MSDLVAAPQPNGEPQHEAARVPKLSVLHLMLWTLCSALYLTVFRAIYAQQGEVGVSAMIQQTSGLIHSMIAGATISGSIVLVTARVAAGPPLLRQPGHWLLLVAAIMAVMLPMFIFPILIINDSGHYIVAVLGVFYLLPSVAFAIAAYRTRGRMWSLLFIGMVLLGVAQALFYISIAFFPASFGVWMSMLSGIASWGSAVLALGVMTVAIVEIKIGPRRDWLHWTGVTTHVASSLASMLWIFA